MPEIDALMTMAPPDPRAERSAAALGRVSRVAELAFEIAEELAGHPLTGYRTAQHAGRPFASADLAW